MTVHAEFGASAADRCMTCPGSVILSRGMPNPDSPYAREGSAAHALGEYCLLNDREPFEFLDEPHPDPQYADVPVNADMVEAVTVYTDHVRSYGVPIEEEMIERRVSLESLGDWAEGMFGTADFIAIVGDTLYVDDYKHGQGVPVDVKDNPQTKYYGLGALLELFSECNDETVALPSRVRTTIIQPRCGHPDGPIRSDEYSVQELLKWGEEDIRSAVEEIRSAELDQGKEGWVDRYLQPSEKGCKFCLAKGKCPKLAQQRMADAFMDFDEDETALPVAAKHELTPEQITRILDNKKAIEEWLKAVTAYAALAAKNGQDVTGGTYDTGPGKRSYSWVDEKKAAGALRRLGLKKADFTEEKFISVSKARTLVGKGDAPKLEKYIETTEGAPSLKRVTGDAPKKKRGAEVDFDEEFLD